jgi:hypothetical protein
MAFQSSQGTNKLLYRFVYSNINSVKILYYIIKTLIIFNKMIEIIVDFHVYCGIVFIYVMI